MAYPVIIIGAGIAGLNAANVLASQGQSVCILEARSRLGGRIHSVSTQSGKQVDLGSLYLSGQGTAEHANPLWPRIKQLGIPYELVDQLNSDAYTTQKQRCSLPQIWESLQDPLKGPVMLLKEMTAVARTHSPSLGSALSYQNNNIPEPDTSAYWARKWVTAAIAQNTGTDIHQLSLQQLMRNPPFTGKRAILIGGCQQLTNALYQEAIYTGKATLHLNQQVKEIYHPPESDSVTVITQQGERYQGSSVICTVPLGVLQNNDIRFFPPLSSKRNATLQHLKVGYTNSIILEFTQSFWPKHVHYLYPNDPDINKWPEYLNLGAFMDDHPPILLAQFHGEQARFGQKTNRDIIAMALEPLRRVYGTAVEKLSQATISHWDTDPYSLGSSSYCTENTTSDDIAALDAPEIGGLYFAGDSTSLGLGESLETAFLSGTQAGLEVSAYLQYRTHHSLTANHRPRR